MSFYYAKIYLSLFSLLPMIRWNREILERMQSYWGCMCYRKLFVTIANLTLISVNRTNFAKTKIKARNRKTVSKKRSFSSVINYAIYKMLLKHESYWVTSCSHKFSRKWESLLIFHRKYCIWVILDWTLKKQISFSKTKAKILTFRTKIALFRYFWTGIWKEKHCYIWSQHPQIIPEAELYTPQKIKILKFRTNNTYVSKFELELKKKKTVVIFEISASKFV